MCDMLRGWGSPGVWVGTTFLITNEFISCSAGKWPLPQPPPLAGTSILAVAPFLPPEENKGMLKFSGIICQLLLKPQRVPGRRLSKVLDSHWLQHFPVVWPEERSLALA